MTESMLTILLNSLLLPTYCLILLHLNSNSVKHNSGFNMLASNVAKVVQTRSFQEDDPYECNIILSMSWNNHTNSAQISIESTDCGLSISSTLKFEGNVIILMKYRMCYTQVLLVMDTSCLSLS